MWLCLCSPLKAQTHANVFIILSVKIKVNFVLDLAMKVQTGSIGIALLFFNLGARWGWTVKVTQAALIPGKRPDVHCIRVWVNSRDNVDGWGKSRPHRNSIPDRPAPTESLYRHFFVFSFTLCTPSVLVSLSCLSCLFVFTVQHTQQKHPCLRRVSNPQSQQATGRKPSP